MKYLLPFLFLIISYNAVAQSPEKKQVTIKGTILEEGTNYPLEYSTVSFINREGKTVTGGITDLDGNYKIDVPTGVYTVDRKSTRLNSSHVRTSYAVFCLKKKKKSRTSRHVGV